MKNKEIFFGLLALLLAIPMGILLAVAYLGRIVVGICEMVAER